MNCYGQNHKVALNKSTDYESLRHIIMENVVQKREQFALLERKTNYMIVACYKRTLTLHVLIVGLLAYITCTHMVELISLLKQPTFILNLLTI